jgi:hypothetical protein
MNVVRERNMPLFLNPTMFHDTKGTWPLFHVGNDELT